MRVQFVQEPGYIHDLFHIFTTAYRINTPEGQETAEEAAFGECPPELYPFFCPKEGGESFMTVLYAAGQDFSQSRGIGYLLQQLRDENEVFRRFLDFYFPDVEEAEQTMPAISRHIYDSAYSDTLKFHLLSFCVDPAGHVRLLARELEEKERKLKKYTEENFAALLNAQAGLEPEALYRLLCPDERPGEDETLFYSLSLLDRDLVRVKKLGATLLLLGCEYESNRLLRSVRYPEPDLVQFGKVMSEVNRQRILDMVLERGELCTADIAREWDTSVTLVYYHLEMMHSTGLLKSRNAGRTLFYSIDGDYFRRVAAALRKYSGD